MDPTVPVWSRSSDTSGCHLPVSSLWEQLLTSTGSAHFISFKTEILEKELNISNRENLKRKSSRKKPLLEVSLFSLQSPKPSAPLLNEHLGIHSKRLFVLAVGVILYWGLLITFKNNVKLGNLLRFKTLLEMEIQYFIWMLVHLSSFSFKDLSGAF